MLFSVTNMQLWASGHSPQLCWWSTELRLGGRIKTVGGRQCSFSRTLEFIFYFEPFSYLFICLFFYKSDRIIVFSCNVLNNLETSVWDPLVWD